VLHPTRPCGTNRPARPARLPNGSAAAGPVNARAPRPCELEIAPSWRFNLGHALLPLRFALHGEIVSPRAGGAAGADASLAAGDASAAGTPLLWWEAENRTIVQRYLELHQKREDDRYCDELPCGLPAHATARGERAERGAPAAAPAPAPTAAPQPPHRPCGSALECFAAPGDVYYFTKPRYEERARRQPGL